MIKDIIYNGITATPSDYSSPDGDLAMAMGVVQENGAMAPILPPKEVLQLEEGDKVLYIHETNKFKHYIIQNSNKHLVWWNGEGEYDATEMRYFATEISEVSSVGNTLIVLDSDGMHYFLWKGGNNNYLYLGTEIPECPLSFGLQGYFGSKDVSLIPIVGEWGNNILAPFPDNLQNNVTNEVLGKVNEAIAKATTEGRFIYPFLLRYAYRLYDGSLIKHSAPILMIAASDVAPYAVLALAIGSHMTVTLETVEHQIDFAAVDQDLLNKVKDWSDIVRSVDVFISKPIYTYDQNGTCKRFVESRSIKRYCVSKLLRESLYPLRYQYNDINDLLYPHIYSLELPGRSEDEINNDIKSCSQFYFLKSIKVEEIPTERTIIEVKEGYLDSLVAREVMTDDYDSHDKIVPQRLFAYNGRLNIANVNKMLFRGHNAESLFNYSDGFVAADTSTENPTLDDRKLYVWVYVFIKQDGNDIVVQCQQGLVGNKAPLLYFYYPNINAYKAIIERDGVCYEVQLQQHDFLNGAFYFNGWDDISVNAKITTAPTVSSEVERLLKIPNQLYTSEINNPFFFPVEGINAIGTGDIISITTAAKALSEGQFGQFPLYAFTTEGVWALEVAANGAYSAKQPITRDVVINANSITQIDSAVLFSSDRGIMLLSGSTAQCISDTIRTDDLFDIKKIPNAEALISIFNSKATMDQKICMDDVAFLPFKDFLSEGRMVYDYTNQRIIVYNPNVRYAYVFSLKSQTWGMMLSDIESNVNSYPEAMTMVKGAKLVDFSKSDATGINTLIITRPFKLDSSQYKSINTIIQRGNFKKGHIKQVLYGSNDLQQWCTVWSSADEYLRGFRGSPYKYFRLAVIGNLDKDETIFGFTTEFENRLTNRLR